MTRKQILKVMHLNVASILTVDMKEYKGIDFDAVYKDGLMIPTRYKYNIDTLDRPTVMKAFKQRIESYRNNTYLMNNLSEIISNLTAERAMEKDEVSVIEDVEYQDALDIIKIEVGDFKPSTNDNAVRYELIYLQTKSHQLLDDMKDLEVYHYGSVKEFVDGLTDLDIANTIHKIVDKGEHYLTHKDYVIIGMLLLVFTDIRTDFDTSMLHITLNKHEVAHPTKVFAHYGNNVAYINSHAKSAITKNALMGCISQKDFDVTLEEFTKRLPQYTNIYNKMEEDRLYKFNLALSAQYRRTILEHIPYIHEQMQGMTPTSFEECKDAIYRVINAVGPEQDLSKIIEAVVVEISKPDFTMFYRNAMKYAELYGSRTKGISSAVLLQLMYVIDFRDD